MIADSPQGRDAPLDGSSGLAPGGSFGRVLLAVDADTHPHVIKTAVSIAEAVDATIDALSVVPMRSSVDHWDIAVERREAEAESVLDRVGEVAGTVSVTKQLRYGDPAEEIELYAEHNGIDLIVAGESQKTGLRRLFSPRSTTELLHRSSSIPMLAVPCAEASTEGSHDHSTPLSRGTVVPSDD